MNTKRTAGQWVDRIVVEQALEHMMDYSHLLTELNKGRSLDSALPLTQLQVDNFIKLLRGEL